MLVRIVALAFTLSLTASLSFAAPVTLLGGAGASWHTGLPAAEDNSSPGTPFWDSNGWDSSSIPDGRSRYNPSNIGALLLGATPSLVPSMEAIVGSPTYDLPGAPGVFEYWADAGLDADPEVAFSHGGGSAWYEFTILAELAARKDVNEIGWYRRGDPTVLNTIFAGSATLGATWQGTIDGDFGFYYRDATRDLLFFTQSALAGQTPGSGQQFGVFRHDNLFYVGIEDRFGPITPRPNDCRDSGVCSDYDYNDFAIAFQQTPAPPVPEPQTLLLLGSGLLGVAAFYRRRSRR